MPNGSHVGWDPEKHEQEQFRKKVLAQLEEINRKLDEIFKLLMEKL